jgi:hypothetical protein
MNKLILASCIGAVLIAGALISPIFFGNLALAKGSCDHVGTCNIKAKNIKMEDVDEVNIILPQGSNATAFDDSALKQKDAALQAQLDAFGAQLQNLSASAITSLEASVVSGGGAGGGNETGNTAGGGGNETGNSSATGGG